MKQYKIGLAILSLAFAVSCTPSYVKDLRSGKQAAEAKEYKLAVRHFDRVIKRNPGSDSALEAAREIAKISHYELQDYKLAATFYRYLIRNSKSLDERVLAQKSIAYIEFENFQHYESAIIELGKLAEITSNLFEKAQIKLDIARAHFYLNQFGQARAEIAELLRMPIEKQSQFQAMVLNGNVLISQKEYAEALKQFVAIQTEFPEMAAEENLGLMLALAYEESGDYKKSISTLEGMKDTYKPVEYIELRIKRLKERLKNQPGAKGYRK